MELRWLRNDRLQAAIAPAVGGGLARLDALRDGQVLPLLRPAPAQLEGAPDPNRAMGCYPLLPWSNRIGGGGFRHDGRFQPVQRNRGDEPWPIHGTGWQQPWQVAAHDHGTLLLRLDAAAEAPFAYRAEQQYRLDGDTLTVQLRVENAGAQPLPFGMGLHPFFVRDADTRLQACARSVWQKGEGAALPDTLRALPPGWSFARESALPAFCIDHGFEGWNGQARVAWPSRGLALQLHSDVSRYVLYTPVDGGFFCFEPVDHPIDALNLPGGGQAHGMTVLAPGQALQRAFGFQLEGP